MGGKASSLLRCAFLKCFRVEDRVMLIEEHPGLNRVFHGLEITSFQRLPFYHGRRIRVHIILRGSLRLKGRQDVPTAEDDPVAHRRYAAGFLCAGFVEGMRFRVVIAY
jgi:hypothetical protein